MQAPCPSAAIAGSSRARRSTAKARCELSITDRLSISASSRRESSLSGSRRPSASSARSIPALSWPAGPRIWTRVSAAWACVVTSGADSIARRRWEMALGIPGTGLSPAGGEQDRGRLLRLGWLLERPAQEARRQARGTAGDRLRGRRLERRDHPRVAGGRRLGEMDGEALRRGAVTGQQPSGIPVQAAAVVRLDLRGDRRPDDGVGERRRVDPGQHLNPGQRLEHRVGGPRVKVPTGRRRVPARPRRRGWPPRGRPSRLAVDAAHPSEHRGATPPG